jgi:serine phosphatase RsbU (regulator of sigma subunit)
MKKLLLSSFIVFSGIIAFLLIFQNRQLNKISLQNKKVIQLDAEITAFHSTRNQVNLILTNPSLWDTVRPYKMCNLCSSPKENSKIDSLCNVILEIQQHIGFKENGQVGKLRQAAHRIEKNVTFKAPLLELRRHEKDFLTRFDTVASRLFKETWIQTSPRFKNDQTCKAYYTYFSSIDSLYNLLYFSKNALIPMLQSEMNQHAELLNSIQKNEVLNTKLVTATMQKNNIIITFSLLILTIVLSFKFSHYFTKSIIDLQENMRKYIASEYDSEILFKAKIPRNEMGSIMMHFIQLTHKITQNIHELEAKVERRTKTIQEKHKQLELQHNEMLQGMRYAKDIQRSLMPNTKEIASLFPQFEVFFQPKDLVGGDFYWAKQVFVQGKEYRILALADCTGHGIPGALLGAIGIQALEDITKENIVETDQILSDLCWYLSQRINRNSREIQDGMDIALLCYDVDKNLLTFSGANQNLWMYDSQTIHEFKGNRNFVGWSLSKENSFIKHSISPTSDSCFYLFTDGICDQFGGEKDKKYGKQNLRNWIQQRHSKLLHLSDFEQEFNTWKDVFRQQTDDCTFISFKCIEKENNHLALDKLLEEITLQSSLPHSHSSSNRNIHCE